MVTVGRLLMVADMQITKCVTRALFALILFAGVLLIAPGAPARHTPAPAPAANATLTAVIHPAAPVRSAAALDAHQLHLLHLAREKPRTVLTAVTGSSRGAAALSWAVASASGHAYVWGGTGPGYDCSGLAMEAYLHADGISLPHSTYSMLASSHLVRTYHPGAGDLAFFGTGHVELYVRAGETFGAHHSGTTVGYRTYGPGYEPTAFYRVS